MFISFSVFVKFAVKYIKHIFTAVKASTHVVVKNIIIAAAFRNATKSY